MTSIFELSLSLLLSNFPYPGTPMRRVTNVIENVSDPRLSYGSEQLTIILLQESSS